MSFNIVKEFENKIANYYGAPYSIAVDSCTHAIELCLRLEQPNTVSFPTHTYVGVPMLGEKLNLNWNWEKDNWIDYHNLKGTSIIDAAVYWHENSYIPGSLMCLSFQFKKHLNIGRGGMILTDNLKSYNKLMLMSHDGRRRDEPWSEQNVKTIGYHYYMIPELAEKGLKKLNQAINTPPRQGSYADYPDLRNMDVFK